MEAIGFYAIAIVAAIAVGSLRHRMHSDPSDRGAGRIDFDTSRPASRPAAARERRAVPARVLGAGRTAA